MATEGTGDSDTKEYTFDPQATIVIGLLASPVFIVLSYWEHYRSTTPSTILNLYLLATIPMDAARARTLFKIPNNIAIASIFTAIVCFKFIILILEAKEKSNLIRPEFKCPSPEQTAGTLNRSFFWWFNPLLLIGFKQSLVVNDLFFNDDALTFDAWRDIIRRRLANADNSKPHALLKVMLATFKGLLLAGIIPRLCLTGVNYAQPFLVSRVVNFIEQPETATSNKIAYGLIAAYAIVYIGIAVMSTISQHKNYRAIVAIRGSAVSLIYHHTLSLSSSSASTSSSLTLINNDVERMGHGMRDVHEIWASLIEIALSLWLLEVRLGVSVAAAVVVIIGCVFGFVKLGMLLSGRQKVWLEAIEARITTTVATLGSIRGIKSTGSTDIVQNIITRLRSDEIRISRKYRELIVGLVTLSYVSTTLAPVFAFATYSIISNFRGTTPLLAASAYTSLTVFSLLGQAVSKWISSTVGIINSIACLERVRQYLATNPRVDPRTIESNNKPIGSSNPAEVRTFDISGTEMLDMGSVDPSPYNPHNAEGLPAEIPANQKIITIRDCSASWKKGSDPAISGINITVLLGSLVMVIGPIGCGKTTLLKVMLGEMPHTTGTVIVGRSKAAFCAQLPWLTNASIRDNIIGVSYLDARWYNTVVKACALDQDFTQLPDGDNTVIGSKGVSLSGGQKSRLALARALYARNDLVILDDIFSGLDAKTERHVFESVLGSHGILRRGGTTTVLATNSVRNISLADHIVVLGPDGKIIDQGTYRNLVYASSYLESLGTREKTLNASEPEKIDDDTVPGLAAARTPYQPSDIDDKRKSDLTIYRYYIDTVGWVTWGFFVLLCSGFVFGLVFPQIWIQFWTEANAKEANHRLGYYLSLYALWSVMAIVIFLGACSWLMIRMVPQAAIKFHRVLLNSALRAPLAYFSTTDSGEVSNRFSQDLELIDMELPTALIGTTITFLSCIAQVGVIIYGSSYVAAAVFGLVILLYYVQLFYLRTSRQLRLLDLEAKAPLLSHFMESINGLVTVRAFGWTEKFACRNYDLLERSQRPFYLLFCAQRWLNLTLELAVAFLAIILVSIVVTTRDTSGAKVGVALVSIVGFGVSLKSLVYNWASLEVAMGAISRIRHFAIHTSSEDQPGEDKTLPPDWPHQGMITFHNVSAAYSPTSHTVLNNLSFSVKAGAKVAICGRTGSGKSSTIAALLRLIDLRSGTITIDGIDISTVVRQELRSKLITLPQEPFYYHATIRENLDIRGQSSTEELLDVLDVVGMREVIDKKGGLDAMANEDPLSHGQSQLLCLARAVLRPNKILIMDESTSSVDKKTEAKMVDIIRERFQDRTVICVAHNLNTIMDYDEVIVLEAGRIVEQGKPSILALEPSKFASLLRAADSEPENASEEETTGAGLSPGVSV
ncbi:p-loop containing nucleoside triphosphate hydrolase [Venustampulla echinocandica]|uniref:p-loop containing nucleoside triphosphate hydrolase n=1 Tax=Venustampulla echinocandica TaxID=2656787 RepID=A0A370TD30_9HELO|nr:p-loop containing nucleoside triphosphate hydrolase [Venustampulla echinocandica]RDL32356.1 p-loop containing nucleoside triphosphate hydrolase [Venustampulla echinocandica]